MSSEWWKSPRIISVVVDNESWILPQAKSLVDWCHKNGDQASLCRTHDEIPEGAVAFYLGCVKITPPQILAKNKRNLVAHASDLPKGRGFSPWTYAVLGGADRIPLCLIEAANDVDAGEIYYKKWIDLAGTELVEDLRILIGDNILELCQKYLSAPTVPIGEPQSGESTTYARRYPKDSVLDPNQTIAMQFDLLRVVDNDKYPAFFEHRGQRYTLKIDKDERDI